MTDLDLVTEAEVEAEKAQMFAAFTGLSLRHLRGEISEALKHFGKFGLLEEYTTHDITHIDAMLEMYSWMIPKDTKELMTPADWLLLTTSTYLHDFGLLVTRDEYDARNEVELYTSFRDRVLAGDDASVRDYSSQVQRLAKDEGERFLYQEFVRFYHAQRIRGWITKTPDLSWGGDPRVVERLGRLLDELEDTFREDIGLVCESHHLDDLQNTAKYPVNKPYGASSSQWANVQYIAFLLRTSDLLHITSDRVPSMAALLINPRNPKSQTEWAKQRAVRSVRAKPVPKNPENGEVSAAQDTVEVHATFSEAEGYFGLTAYLHYATKQLQQTFAWSKENQATGESAYVFPWRSVDTTHIKANGFVTEQFVFDIDQAKILDLLTGHTLYNDTGVVLRELVQNSLDAVRLKAYIESSNGEAYAPRIDIAWNSSDQVLVITDNGIGMSQEVIEQNFLRVGSSRYQEPEFRKEFPDFASISRFGIGVLSTFMVADDVTVSTVHPSEPLARSLSLRDVHGQYLVRLLPKSSLEIPTEIREHGTSISIKLRPSAQLADVEAILRQWIVVPECDVFLKVDGSAEKRIGHESVSDALKEALVSANLVHLAEAGLRTAFGAPVKIRTSNIDSLEIAFAVTWNEWLEEWGYVLLEHNRPDTSDAPFSGCGICVGGIRVTSDSPGFTWGGVAALANASGPGAPRTNVARSAIEKTEEYDKMLNGVYSAYVNHIVSEVGELVTERASSLTRAAQEAAFLADDLAKANPTSTKIRNLHLRTVPAIVVEEGGTRKSYSLEELSSHEELATIESTTVSSFESVLKSVRGASSPSLRNLVEALGSDEILPEVPLLSGVGQQGLISKLFADEWEIARLATDDDGRTLRAFWRKKGSAPKWWTPNSRTRHTAVISNRLGRELGIGRTGNQGKLLLPLQPSEIEHTGFEGKSKLLLCQGWLVFLPDHAMMSINPASPDVPDEMRLWSIYWLFNILRDSTRRRLIETAAGSRKKQENPRYISDALALARSSDLFDILDENSTREALQLADLEPLDVYRWDRRKTSE